MATSAPARNATATRACPSSPRAASTCSRASWSVWGKGEWGGAGTAPPHSDDSGGRPATHLLLAVQVARSDHHYAEAEVEPVVGVVRRDPVEPVEQAEHEQ